MKTIQLAFVLSSLTLVACGGDAAPPKAPESTASSAPAMTAPPATPEPAMTAPPASAAATPPPPPAMKGAFTTFTKAATSGKVDKVGEKDGAFKGDGVKDMVFDVEFEGAAAAFFIASVDAKGEPTGEFDADTLTGGASFPPELTRALNAGGYTAGIVVYEGDKLKNEKDGALTPFPEGKRKLTFHVSAKTAPKGPVRVYAMLTDKTVIAGPVLAGK